MELSLYQKNILNFIEESNDNLLVNAKAGSGKTFTLVLLSNKLIENNKKCLFLAFNKSIVEELNKRITSNNCSIKTIHSLGYSFLKSFLYRKHKDNYELRINNDKMLKIIEFYFNEICFNDFKFMNFTDSSENDFKNLIYNTLYEINLITNFCRLYNINYHISEEVLKLIDKPNFYILKHHEEYGLKDFTLVVEKTLDQIKYDFSNPEKDNYGKYIYNIDFTDMIYFPCYYNLPVPYSIKPYLDYILIDECQDLSILQQNFLKLLNNGNTRYIFIGDEKQAIYGFAGSDTDSVNNLRNYFNLQEKSLDICYRCPENIIKIAKTIVPSIKANDLREDKGLVKFINYEESFKEVKPNDIIIGRKNSDLLKFFKHMVFDKHSSIKFKNIEIVNNILNDLYTVISQYIQKYNKGHNIEVELFKRISYSSYSQIRHLPKEKLTEIDKLRKQLINLFSKQTKIKNRSNYTIDYLELCMKEFKELGAYKFLDEKSPDYNLRDYYFIIKSLLDIYRQENNNISLENFKDFISNFLKGNIDKEVPILSSVHMMKGGEADRVFIIDYPRFPYGKSFEDIDVQEENLQYVALTRAKQELYLIKINENDHLENKEDIIRLNLECIEKVTYQLKEKIS